MSYRASGGGGATGTVVAGAVLTMVIAAVVAIVQLTVFAVVLLVTAQEKVLDLGLGALGVITGQPDLADVGTLRFLCTIAVYGGGAACMYVALLLLLHLHLIVFWFTAAALVGVVMALLAIWIRRNTASDSLSAPDWWR